MAAMPIFPGPSKAVPRPLAQAVGLTGEECDQLLHAAPMHDIGKIGIPDRVLLKPGKLDEGEWEIMKTHTVIGAGNG